MARLKQNERQFAPLLGVTVTVLMVAMLALIARTGSVVGLFLTPDQRAQRLLDRGEYINARAQFSQPLRHGVALFRAGAYKKAAAAFARVNTAAGHFNRANSLVMLGKYADAVKVYGRSLELRPEWTPAVDNRHIARLRGERIKHQGGDMTGGKLGADKIIMEPGKSENQQGQTEVTAGGQQMSEQELQALWLRRVQTKPADFLRAKFAFQLVQTHNDTETTSQP
jgi:Ca-activated chloride channel family protein